MADEADEAALCLHKDRAIQRKTGCSALRRPRPLGCCWRPRLKGLSRQAAASRGFGFQARFAQWAATYFWEEAVVF